MTPNNIANIRIVSQQIAGTEFRTAKELVAWMGAMQAQDCYNTRFLWNVKKANPKRT